MNKQVSLKMAILVLACGLSHQALADDAADLAKVDQAADQQASCPQNKDIQKVVIYYDGDEAALQAQLMAYANNDARREGNAINCINQIGLAIEVVNTNPTFASKLKDRIRGLISTLSMMVQKNQNLRINGPVSAIGIRG
ncbi:MAG: hypothetical protein ACXVA9_03165 [Bdellovibrionales bacterium]